MKILCISDGLGVDSEGCPKWPTLLSLLINHKIVNKSVVGAGSEIMLAILYEEITNNNYDHVIIQWSMPRRLDVICNDNQWVDIAKNDPVYSFNLNTVGKNVWWSSSASSAEEVKLYKKFISYKQFELRSYANMLAACQLLEQKSIPYSFTLSYDLKIIPELSNKNWVWHDEFKGMREYSTLSKFSYLDNPDCPRPHPLVHLDWIYNILLPHLKIEVDNKKYLKLEASMIERTEKNLILQK